jgi:hypothetical protein
MLSSVMRRETFFTVNPISQNCLGVSPMITVCQKNLIFLNFYIFFQLPWNKCKQQNKHLIPFSFTKILVCDTWNLIFTWIQQKFCRWNTMYIFLTKISCPNHMKTEIVHKIYI